MAFTSSEHERIKQAKGRHTKTPQETQEKREDWRTAQRKPEEIKGKTKKVEKTSCGKEEEGIAWTVANKINNSYLACIV